LWQPERFNISDADQQRMFAGFYGLLLAMFAYNLLLFLSLRDASYGYYVLYVGCFGLFQFSLNGLGFEYLWPESPRWGQMSIPFFLSLSLVAMLQFSRLFLQLAQNLPRVNTLLRASQGLLLLVPPLLLVLDYSPLIRGVTLFGLVSSVLICLCGWFVWLRCRLQQARYFVFAWTCLLAGMLLYALKTFNVLPSNFITSYALQIGAGLEVLLLSFALAHRLKILEAENKQIQRDHAAQLVQQVNERTGRCSSCSPPIRSWRLSAIPFRMICAPRYAQSAVSRRFWTKIVATGSIRNISSICSVSGMRRSACRS
jgi:hypothetical protein